MTKFLTIKPLEVNTSQYSVTIDEETKHINHTLKVKLSNPLKYTAEWKESITTSYITGTKTINYDETQTDIDSSLIVTIQDVYIDCLSSVQVEKEDLINVIDEMLSEKIDVFNKTELNPFIKKERITINNNIEMSEWEKQLFFESDFTQRRISEIKKVAKRNLEVFKGSIKVREYNKKYYDCLEECLDFAKCVTDIENLFNKYDIDNIEGTIKWATSAEGCFVAKINALFLNIYLYRDSVYDINKITLKNMMSPSPTDITFKNYISGVNTSYNRNTIERFNKCIPTRPLVNI